VAEQQRELSAEDYEKFMDELVNSHILPLINSSLTSEKIGGITAIGSLSPIIKRKVNPRVPG
jgi:hypothetical protein